MDRVEVEEMFVQLLEEYSTRELIDIMYDALDAISYKYAQEAFDETETI